MTSHYRTNVHLLWPRIYFSNEIAQDLNFILSQKPESLSVLEFHRVTSGLDVRRLHNTVLYIIRYLPDAVTVVIYNTMRTFNELDSIPFTQVCGSVITVQVTNIVSVTEEVKKFKLFKAGCHIQSKINTAKSLLSNKSLLSVTGHPIRIE